MTTPSDTAIVLAAGLYCWAFVMFGALCVAYPADLVHTPLGRALLGAIALFWLFRAIEQAWVRILKGAAPAAIPG